MNSNDMHLSRSRHVAPNAQDPIAFLLYSLYMEGFSIDSGMNERTVDVLPSFSLSTKGSAREGWLGHMKTRALGEDMVVQLY